MSLKILHPESREQRRHRADLIGRELLYGNPCCSRCGLDVVQLGMRRNQAAKAYLEVAHALQDRGERVPEQWIEDARPFRMVYEALRAMGFDRPDGALFDIDHVVPLWKGGLDDVANMVVMCQPCHRAKTGREAGERKRARRRESAPDRRIWSCRSCKRNNFPRRDACWSCGAKRA